MDSANIYNNYALNAIETLKREQAEREAKRLKNDVLAKPEYEVQINFTDDEMKRLAGFIADELEKRGLVSGTTK